MDIAIRHIFEETINTELDSIIISNSTDKTVAEKVKIRPVMIKGDILYQASEFIGVKVFHSNYSREELLNQLPRWFEGLFRQAEIMTKRGKATVLISKKGKVTVIDKLSKNRRDEANTSDMAQSSPENIRIDSLSHNKKKNYILEEGIPISFLVDLGVMTSEGKVVKARSDKFRQINRFLEFIEDVLPHLSKNRELTILDFGCGKSYLTFAMYYYLKILKGYPIQIIGLDLKADVIKTCNELSLKYGYDGLRFLEGDIASYEGVQSVDMVVTLHACDTATDYALFKAVRWGAQVILSVPCCQHELNKQIKSEVLKPVLGYGIIKERMAALITDALRAEILEAKGYKVQILEFIDMEHTPKNILIRAVKRSNTRQERPGTEEKLQACMEFLQVSPCLLRLFQEDEIEEGEKCD